MFNVKKLKKSLLVVGVVAIVLAVAVFLTDVGSRESNEYYGGDAYTGIQQAAAQTANNVQEVGKMIRLGISGVLLVEGLAFLSVAFCLNAEKKEEVKDTLSQSSVECVNVGEEHLSFELE